jgi:hypothetical protein
MGANDSVYGFTIADVHDGSVKALLLRLLVAQPSYIKDRLDPEIKDLSQKVGLYSTDQITIVPATGQLHYGIMRWAERWLCKQVCLDWMGQNNIELANTDKYLIKYEVYRREEAQMRKEVTKEMFLNIVVRNTDRAIVSVTITRA